VPDWDNTESREPDEDAAWRDLVARFDAPLAAQEPVPWPDREDVSAVSLEAEETGDASGTGGASEADGEPGTAGADELDRDHGRHAADSHQGRPEAEADQGRHAADPDQGRHAADPDLGRHAADGEMGRHAADGDRGVSGLSGIRGPYGLRSEPPGAGGGTGGRHERLGADGAHDPEVIQVPRMIRRSVARDIPADGSPGTLADDDEHFIPPAPPPLPKLDPLAKGAWAALFGGPGYLVVATAAGWSVSGLAAFLAVAAFVAGFAILVLRMHDPDPGGPDDGDDGAVV
jgi:hypothetical protein